VARSRHRTPIADITTAASASGTVVRTAAFSESPKHRGDKRGNKNAGHHSH